MRPTLVLIAPEILAVRASQQQIDDPHIEWYVGYAPERDDANGARVVFGTIHAASAQGVADVTVAGMMRYPASEEPGTEAFADILAESDALETLWDIARGTFRAIATIANLDVEVPAKAPVAEISQLMRSEEADESGDAEAHAEEPANEF